VSIGYARGRGPLRRSHPYTPLTLAGATAILAFALPAPWGPVALSGVLLGLVLVERAPVLGPALLTALPFWLFLFLIHGVFGNAPMTALGLGARIFSIILGFLLALATVHPARFVEALAARGVSFSLAYLLTATLQAVPRLRARAAEILAAQRCRGLRVRGSLLRRVRAVVPLTVPLVLSVLSDVDERSVALEARGMGGKAKRTPLSPPADPLPERVLRWTLVLATAAAIAVRVL
jgi:energy-coupling factor transport system permease protein